MKKTLLAASISTLVAVGIHGQGTVNFANGAAGVSAPVTLESSGAALAGPDWQAELLLVGAGGGLTKVGDAITFGEGDVAGYFFGGLVTIPGVDAGQEATLRIRAFNIGASLEALSEPVTVTLGGGVVPPPNLVGLQAWTVGQTAARPVLKIAVSGAVATLSWSEAFPNAQVEYSYNVEGPTWSVLNRPRTLEGSEYKVTVSSGTRRVFFRLRQD